MQVSVIIPVYNAAQYVTQAVESALMQPETAEVILIEDGSPDNALEVCQALKEKYDKVKLLRHPSGENRGAGASRNLGMKNAKYDFIAFLDADDYYLSDRFKNSHHIFLENPDCEGVYEAVCIEVKNELASQRLASTGQKSEENLISITEIIDPDLLGECLIMGSSGYFHIDGLVIKKMILGKVGFMSEQLRLHQDTEWMVRCALTARLYPGSLKEPKAIVNVHEQNRFFAPITLSRAYHNRMKFWISLYHWAKINTTKEIQNLIRQRIIYYIKSHKYIRNFPRKHLPTRLIRFFRLLRLLGYPEIILDSIKLQLLKN